MSKKTFSATNPNKSSKKGFLGITTVILVIILGITILVNTVTGKFSTETDSKDTSDLKDTQAAESETDVDNIVLGSGEESSKQPQYAVPESDVTAGTSQKELNLLKSLETRARKWCATNKPTLKYATITDIYDATIADDKSVTFKGALSTSTKKGNYIITLKDNSLTNGESEHSILKAGYYDQNPTDDQILKDLQEVINDDDLEFSMQANTNIIDFTDLDKGAIATNIIKGIANNTAASSNLKNSNVYETATYSLYANSAKQYGEEGNVLYSYTLHTYTDNFVYESLVTFEAPSDLGTSDLKNMIRKIIQNPNSQFKTTVERTDIYDKTINSLSSETEERQEEEIDIYSK